MNKKGFTLAEMLGVIVILAVITILALPPLLQSIRDNKSKLSSATEKLIFSATDLYLSNRANEYPRYNGSIYCVVINDLVESGDLLDDLKDVNTNANVDMTKMIKIEVNNGKYVKRIVESNECDRYMNFDYNSNISAVQGSTIPQCITDNFTCSLEDMKAGLPVMINVDGTNKYKFYIINDNDGLLTLISSSNYGNNINYSDSASNINGPDKALTNLPTNWINVVNQGSIIDNDVIIDYSGYSARLPKASEIASLADTNNWNQTVVSTIPAFLKENVGGGYWMSTGNSTNKAWFVLNSLNNSVITNSYKVRPVINIYKSSIGVGPLVSVKNEEEIEIISGSDNELIDYFNISSNGAMDIGNTSCVSSIDGNVTNTDDLSAGLHNITCTATSLSGLTSSDVKRIKVYQSEYTFDYTGNSQTFAVPFTGTYRVELWGASGNNNYSDYTLENASYGGYVAGNINLNSEMELYISVGGMGMTYNCCSQQGVGAKSGGATDIRLIQGTWDNFDGLKSRLMVAGGAGGSYTDPSAPGGGSAGGLESYYVVHQNHPVKIATQINGGAPAYLGTAGTFGIGGIASTGGYNSGAGGYYGGGGGPAGGGGSSFISGHDGCNAISESSTSSNIIHTGQPNHYSGKVFTDTLMIDGAGYKWTNVIGNQQRMPTPTGELYELGVGHSGNGYAKITLISID